MSDDHSTSYIDGEGEERCETCDKWIEPGCYEIEDHFKAMQDEPLHRPYSNRQEANGESMVPVRRRLVRAWDRNYNLRGQQFVAWNQGTFTIAADDPMAVELWDNREANHQITVESTTEMVWWIERMDRMKDGTLVVTCQPHVDILRKCIIPDWKLVEDWLEAEKQWKARQQCSLTDRLAAVIAEHEPTTDHEGADGECIECDLNPRWPDAPILPPSDGWQRHARHLAAAVVADLLANAPDEPAWDWKTR